MTSQQMERVREAKELASMDPREKVEPRDLASEPFLAGAVR